MMDKVHTVMREFKMGTLHSGRNGKVVHDRKQAIAIALSESRRHGGETFEAVRRWRDR